MDIAGVADLVMGDTIAIRAKTQSSLQEATPVVGVGSMTLSGARVAIQPKKSTGACVLGAPCSQKFASIAPVASTRLPAGCHVQHRRVRGKRLCARRARELVLTPRAETELRACLAGEKLERSAYAANRRPLRTQGLSSTVASSVFQKAKTVPSRQSYAKRRKHGSSATLRNQSKRGTGRSQLCSC